MYRVISAFFDAKNNEYLYQVGDKYPVEGYKPTKTRPGELISKGFIEEVLDEEIVDEEIVDEEVIDEK